MFFLCLFSYFVVVAVRSVLLLLLLNIHIFNSIFVFVSYVICLIHARNTHCCRVSAVMWPSTFNPMFLFFCLCCAADIREKFIFLASFCFRLTSPHWLYVSISMAHLLLFFSSVELISVVGQMKNHDTKKNFFPLSELEWKKNSSEISSSRPDIQLNTLLDFNFFA